MNKVPGKMRWLSALAVVILMGLLLAVRARSGSSAQYFTAKVARGTIRDAVELTATINAVKTVLVGSQVSGTISKLNVDFNDPVHTGEIIALIDPALFRGAVQQAVADLDGAKANLVAAEANLDKAQATVVQMKDDYDRNVPLLARDYVTKESLVASKANYDIAKASLSSADAGVVQARAQVNMKAAAVAVAQTNLDYTVIRSPIDGVVVARNVDVGQTVAASLQAPTIFTIAQDLTKMQLYAKTDESDVGRVRLRQVVTFKVDAFPKETFQGVVSEIRMNATTVQNVVTYDAIIDFANPERKLFPGMTAYVTIPVASVENVVAIPNGALRYRPPLSPDRIRALYAKYGFTDDARAILVRSTADSASRGHSHTASPDYGVVWKRHADNTIEPVRIALGITDHATTQVLAIVTGRLEPGDDVITGAALPGGASAPPR